MRQGQYIAIVGLVWAAAALVGCVGLPAPGQSRAQAEFDQACKYANGVLASAKPVIPLVQGLLQARFGEDSSLAFQGLVKTVETACGQPLDLANSGQVVQRIYDAGGQIVALVIKSQAG